MRRHIVRHSILLVSALFVVAAFAQSDRMILNGSPDRKAGEGEGPFDRMVIRGVTLIDGTGGPPRGPWTSSSKATASRRVGSAGSPGLPIASANRAPQRRLRDRRHRDVRDARLRRPARARRRRAEGADAEYSYKLWLAHGVTTVRGVPLAAACAGPLKEKARQREERDRRAAHLQLPAPGSGVGRRRRSGRRRRRASGSRWAAANGIDGIKLGARASPDIMAALLDEAKKLNMGIHRASASRPASRR